MIYVRIIKYINYCLSVSHHGEPYSVFVIAFTACHMSYSGLQCSVIRQVEHWCWCYSEMCSVSVDQLRSTFVCDIVPCCWVFGVWHFDAACWYHSPTNITLYCWTGKVLCYFLHDPVSFSQNHCFSILCTYLVVIIHSTVLLTSCRNIYSNIITAVACVFTFLMIYDVIYLLTAIRLTPSGSSTVHIYTETITQNNTINFVRVQAMPHLCGFYPHIFLTTEKKHGKTSVRVPEECHLAWWK
jgi:hypothetical protein